MFRLFAKPSAAPELIQQALAELSDAFPRSLSRLRGADCIVLETAISY